MTMSDRMAMQRMDAGSRVFGTRVPGLTRDLPATREAPDQVRGAVAPVADRSALLAGETI